MTTSKGFTTAAAIANDWLTDNEMTDKIREDLIKRWIHNRTEELIETEQLKYGVALLNVDDFVAKTPDGLHSVYTVICIADGEHCWNREQLVGYTQHLYGTDCEVDVNIKCPKCSKTSCNCSSAVFEVDIDRMYMEERPYLWAMHSDHYIGYSAATTDGFPCNEEGFLAHVMTPRTSDSLIWNSEFFVGVCAGLGENIKGRYKYDITPPTFHTDMKKGQVLIAYLKYMRDEEGYNLVPNHPEVVRAISAYLTAQVMTKNYFHGTAANQTDRLQWLDATRQADALLVQVRSMLETPSADKWASLINKHMRLGRDRFYYK